jgi:hypothetical protein
MDGERSRSEDETQEEGVAEKINGRTAEDEEHRPFTNGDERQYEYEYLCKAACGSDY